MIFLTSAFLCFFHYFHSEPKISLRKQFMYSWKLSLHYLNIKFLTFFIGDCKKSKISMSIFYCRSYIYSYGIYFTILRFTVILVGNVDHPTNYQIRWKNEVSSKGRNTNDVHGNCPVVQLPTSRFQLRPNSSIFLTLDVQFQTKPLSKW